MSGLETLRGKLPALFARGIALLEQRAGEGDARARASLEDARAAAGTTRVVVDGAGEIFLVVRDGAMTVEDAAPAGMKVRLAAAAPADAFAAALGEVERAKLLDGDRAAIRFAASASGRAEKVLDKYPFGCHVSIAGVPDLGDVTVRVAVGSGELAAKPRFTATVRFDDLEDLRGGMMNPQQLLMGGKVRFAGDYSPLLQLGMELMQLDATRRRPAR